MSRRATGRASPDAERGAARPPSRSLAVPRGLDRLEGATRTTIICNAALPWRVLAAVRDWHSSSSSSSTAAHHVAFLFERHRDQRERGHDSRVQQRRPFREVVGLALREGLAGWRRSLLRRGSLPRRTSLPRSLRSLCGACGACCEGAAEAEAAEAATACQCGGGRAQRRQRQALSGRQSRLREACWRLLGVCV